MLKTFLIVTFLSLSVSVFSQNYAPEENTYYFHILENRIKLDYLNNTFLIGDTTNKDVSKLDISYRSSKGGFHKSQEPYKSSATLLQTEGVYTLKKLKIAGSFLFDKQWDDSLKNNLNGIFDDATPYYYFANKAGKFERQNYQFKALASYSILPRISAGMALDYNYHWSTGSVDPRPDVKIFSYLLKPEITFHLPKTLIGIQGLWGKGTENSGVVYKNSNYSVSLLYPDRIFYMNHGYGYITMKDQSIYQRRRSYKGFGININKAIANWETFVALSYMKRDDGNTKEKYASSHLDYYSKWHLQTWNAKIFAEKKGDETVQQLNLDVAFQKGRDWDSIFNANNYQYNNLKAKIGYFYFNNLSTKYQLGVNFEVHYEDLEKIDLLQAHHIHYETVEPSIMGYFYYRANNFNRISFNIGPSLVFPVKKLITVPETQINVFTQNVVYPDYYFWSSTSGKITIGSNWISRSFLKKKECGFFTLINYWRQFNTSSIAYESLTKPSKNRFTWTAGFRLYL